MKFDRTFERVIHTFLPLPLWEGVGGWVFLLLLAASCTKYDTPASVNAGIEKVDSVALRLTRRVLWVNIDGARGSLVREMCKSGELPTLAAMLQHSKYAFDGISDSGYGRTGASVSTSGEDPLSWASMLTGVGGYEHYIHDGSYLADYPLGSVALGQKVSYFPTLVQYLSAADASLAVSVVTPWANLNKYLADAASVTTTTTDDETEQTLAAQLADKDFRLTIASLRGVQDAGQSGGFTTDNSAYRQALIAADARLATLKSTIEGRADKDYEDWLIAVTSNIGGPADFSDASRDIFGLFYYDHYTEREMHGETVTAPLFRATDLLTAEVEDSVEELTLCNKSRAIEFNLRQMPKSDGTFGGNNWGASISAKTSGECSGSVPQSPHTLTEAWRKP